MKDALGGLTRVQPDQRARVSETLKRTIEGELIALASAPKPNVVDAGHSKTGVTYHSKSGASHSKSSVVRLEVSGVDEEKHAEFAARVMRLRAEMSGQ